MAAIFLENGLKTGQTIEATGRIFPNNDSMPFVKERFHRNKGGETTYSLQFFNSLLKLWWFQIVKSCLIFKTHQPIPK